MPTVCSKARVACPCCGMWQWEGVFSRALPELSLGVTTCAGAKGFFIRRHRYADQDSEDARASMRIIGQRMLARLRAAVGYLEGVLNEEPSHLKEKREWLNHGTEWSSKGTISSALTCEQASLSHWIAAPESRSTLGAGFASLSTSGDVAGNLIPVRSSWKESKR